MSENNSSLALLEGALSIDKMMEFRGLIEKAMAKAMVENKHYGKIQGCGEKPTLLQPGAQILCTLFRMRPEYEIFESEPAPGHKAYRITCRLFLMGADNIEVGQGVGEASSMESKHRFRNAAAVVEDTGEPVPPMFWDIKNKEGIEEAKAWLATAFNGEPVSAKKFGDEGWRVVIVRGGGDEKIENSNPADVFNTVLKMGKKRAFVDATITATSSSDFFTQDLEDIRDNIQATNKAEAATTAKKEKPAAGDTKKAKPEGSGEAAGAPGSWQEVVCHIGKPKGPINGKKLGELDKSQREWLLGKMKEKGERRDAKEKKLYAALLIWQEESATGKKEAKAQKQEEKGTQAQPGNEGTNLEILKSNLEWADIPCEVFLKVADSNQWTEATEFADIKESEAIAMIEQMEAVIEACKQEISLQAGTGGLA